MLIDFVAIVDVFSFIRNTLYDLQIYYFICLMIFRKWK